MEVWALWGGLGRRKVGIINHYAVLNGSVITHNGIIGQLKAENKMTKKQSTEMVVKKDEVAGFIAQAIEKNLPVETMERLFTLHKEVKAEHAREEFVSALADFQAECPIIKKTKQVLNKDGRTVRYSYAPIDSVIEQIKKTLAGNGFSYNWDSAREEKHIKVICKLTHNAGHFETSTFDIPIVPSEFMSSPQSYATAQSYAKRYTLLNVLGIGTAEEDTDAQDTDNKGAKSNKARIVFLLRGLGNKTETKQEIEKAVAKLTELTLEEKNYDEIVSRLEVITAERGL